MNIGVYLIVSLELFAPNSQKPSCHHQQQKGTLRPLLGSHLKEENTIVCQPSIVCSKAITR